MDSIRVAAPVLLFSAPGVVGSEHVAVVSPPAAAAFEAAAAVPSPLIASLLLRSCCSGEVCIETDASISGCAVAVVAASAGAGMLALSSLTSLLLVTDASCMCLLL